jgi:hypothetical protein
MNGAALERLRARAQAVRTRAAIRRWQYRQRDLADGVWFRLRRVLAGARAAYVISDDDARILAAEGYVTDPSGRGIVPEKQIFFVEASRLAALPSARPIPVSLGPEFLGARAVALVAFEG